MTIDEWAEFYLPERLKAGISYLDLLAGKMPNFARLAQRMRREVVGDLIRSQHLLPWTSKARPQFFSEQRTDRQQHLKEREHAFPVSQVKSLVMMAIRDGDVEQARKRLVYCWLIPTVLCSKETHAALPRRCEDFDRPYDRYSRRHQGLRSVSPGMKRRMRLLVFSTAPFCHGALGSQNVAWQLIVRMRPFRRSLAFKYENLSGGFSHLDAMAEAVTFCIVRSYRRNFKNARSLYIQNPFSG